MSYETGLFIPVINQIKTMSADDWECFVEEWMSARTAEYFDFERLGGAGDQGRDVVGFVDNPVGNNSYVWDKYQCKHYSNPLSPSMIWAEIGKVCYFSYVNDYPFPRKYYFVAPLGIGTKLSNLLRKPNELKSQLLENWDKYCKSGITDNSDIELNSKLKAFIDSLDFSIFDKIKPITLILEHSKTQFHTMRFNTPLPNRPQVPKIPDDVLELEINYVNKLVNAYDDNCNDPISNVADVISNKKYASHFTRSRESFGHAESLRNFSRDNLPDGMFEDLQGEILDGIIEVVDEDKLDGYETIKKSIGIAKLLQLSRTKLSACTTPKDRGGICHQLANDDFIDWSKDD